MDLDKEQLEIDFTASEDTNCFTGTQIDCEFPMEVFVAIEVHLNQT